MLISQEGSSVFLLIGGHEEKAILMINCQFVVRPLYKSAKEAIMVMFIILQERVQPRQRRVRWGRAERQLQDLTSHVQVQPSCHNCLRASCPYKPTTPNLAISSLLHSTFSVATFKAEGPWPTPSGPFVTFYRCVFCISHYCQ